MRIMLADDHALVRAAIRALLVAMPCGVEVLEVDQVGLVGADEGS